MSFVPQFVHKGRFDSLVPFDQKYECTMRHTRIHDCFSEHTKWDEKSCLCLFYCSVFILTDRELFDQIQILRRAIVMRRLGYTVEV
mgnify:FL=1